MADNDFNLIHAVESLPPVPSVTPAKQREERKRRRKGQAREYHEPDKESSDGTVEEQPPGREDTHAIDYCA